MSGGADIQSQFQRFLEAQLDDHEVFESLRQAIVALPDYRPYSDELTEIERLVDEELFNEARSRLHASMPTFILSPRAHELQARVAAAEYDSELAQEEREAAMACLEAISLSGDGSREHPYRVLRTTDEYDFLDHLQLTMQQQQVIHVGECHYDVLTCSDGRQVWFDITEAYNRLGGDLGET